MRVTLLGLGAVVVLVVVAAASLARADTTVQGPKPTGIPQGFLEDMAYVMAVSATADAKAPLKARDYAGSNTLLRGAVSYAILRSVGRDVVIPNGWGAKEPYIVGSLFAFHDGANLTALEAAFTQRFKQPLVKRRSGDGERALIAYDPAGLRAAFAALYVAPSTGGAPARAIYDSFFKAFVAKKAEVVALAIANRGALATAAREYTRRASEPGFDGLAVSEAFAKTLPAPARDDVRLVGTILRREADGTLPELLTMLRRTLADYDAPTSKRLDARLRR